MLVPTLLSAGVELTLSRAMTLLEQNRYLSSTISQNGNNSHTVTVGANVEELKFMIYWTDYEASTIAAQALVNNIDLKVVTTNRRYIITLGIEPHTKLKCCFHYESGNKGN